MLTIPAFRESLKQKRDWYEKELGIPVIGDGIDEAAIEPGRFPIVITSRDKKDSGIEVPLLEDLIRNYILLETQINFSNGHGYLKARTASASIFINSEFGTG